MPVDPLDPPWRLDPLQTITKARWSSSIAVLRNFVPSKLALYSPTGDLKWELSGGVDRQWIDVAQGPNGTVAIGGRFIDDSPFPSSFYTAMVWMYDRNGSLMWSNTVKAAHPTNSALVTRVCVDSAGAVIYDAESPGIDVSEGYIIGKISKTGSTLWTNTALIPASDGFDGAIKTDKNAKIAGSRAGVSPSIGVWFLSPGGGTVGTLNLGTGFHQQSQFDDEGNFFIVTGTAFGSGGTVLGSQIQKYSPAGTQLWSNALGVTTNLASGLDTDTKGNVWVASDGILQQYSPTGSLLTTFFLGNTAKAIGVKCVGKKVAVLRKAMLPESLGDSTSVLTVYSPVYDEDGNLLEWVQDWTVDDSLGYNRIATRWLSPPPPEE